MKTDQIKAGLVGINHSKEPKLLPNCFPKTPILYFRNSMVNRGLKDLATEDCYHWKPSVLREKKMF